MNVDDEVRSNLSDVAVATLVTVFLLWLIFMRLGQIETYLRDIEHSLRPVATEVPG